LAGISELDKTVTAGEWEAAGSTAYIDGSGKIKLGIPPEVKARRDEISFLIKRELKLGTQPR
jgi:hypothetical protein